MVKNGKDYASVIYFPTLNKLYCADEENAYCNGTKLTLNVDKTNMLIDQIYLKNEVEFNEIITKNIKKEYKLRIFRKFYCASLSFCFVAEGSLSSFIFAKNLPWDYTPGMHIVKCAGGKNLSFTHNNTEYFVSAVNETDLRHVVDAIKKSQ